MCTEISENPSSRHLQHMKTLRNNLFNANSLKMYNSRALSVPGSLFQNNLLYSSNWQLIYCIRRPTRTGIKVWMFDGHRSDKMNSHNLRHHRNQRNPTKRHTIRQSQRTTIARSQKQTQQQNKHYPMICSRLCYATRLKICNTYAVGLRRLKYSRQKIAVCFRLHADYIIKMSYICRSDILDVS